MTLWTKFGKREERTEMKSVVYINRKCVSWYTVNNGWIYIPSTYEYILTWHIYSAKSVWRIVSLLYLVISSAPCGPSCEPSPSNCINDTSSVQTSPFKTSPTTGVCNLSSRHINKNKSVQSPIVFDVKGASHIRTKEHSEKSITTTMS